MSEVDNEEIIRLSEWGNEGLRPDLTVILDQHYGPDEPLGLVRAAFLDRRDAVVRGYVVLDAPTSLPGEPGSVWAAPEETGADPAADVTAPAEATESGCEVDPDLLLHVQAAMHVRKDLLRPVEHADSGGTSTS